MVNSRDHSKIRVTDLRAGSPDGTDLNFETEVFVFAGEVVDLV